MNYPYLELFPVTISFKLFQALRNKHVCYCHVASCIVSQIKKTWHKWLWNICPAGQMWGWWESEEKKLTTSKEWKELGTCAAVILFFNPFGSFLPPFPTFSVLIDKHREGKKPRDESFWLLLLCVCVCVFMRSGWASQLWSAAVSCQLYVLIWFQLVPWLSICVHYDVNNNYKKVVLNICLKGSLSSSMFTWFVIFHL